jgi:hypothetical protein
MTSDHLSLGYKLVCNTAWAGKSSPSWCYLHVKNACCWPERVNHLKQWSLRYVIRHSVGCITEVPYTVVWWECEVYGKFSVNVVQFWYYPGRIVVQFLLLDSFLTSNPLARVGLLPYYLCSVYPFTSVRCDLMWPRFARSSRTECLGLFR